MKSKSHFLKAIPEIVGWFSIVAGITILGSVLGVLIAFQVSRTPGLVIGGFICLAIVCFGIRVVIKSSKGRGAVEFLSRTIASPEMDNNAPMQDPKPQIVLK